jgi:hypothetical protein
LKKLQEDGEPEARFMRGRQGKQRPRENALHRSHFAYRY